MKPHLVALLRRFAPLLWLAAVFCSLALLTRIALLIKTGDGVPASAASWLYLFGVGFLFDLAAFVYFAIPLLLYLWLMPVRAYRSNPSRVIVAILSVLFLYILLFVVAAEWLFWDEFESRFNFIAVDYLVYSREVIGNIRASFPVGKILASMAVIAVPILYFTRRLWIPQDPGTRFRDRTTVALTWFVAAILVTVFVDSEQKNRTDNEFVNELAGDGVFEFFSAYRNNELDYERLYKVLPDRIAFDNVRDLIKTPEAQFINDDPYDIARRIENPAPEKHLNVVLISVESLSADFLTAFGNKKNITPKLDALAQKSLFFTRLYASGTRTVRGLEALALSVPPTPGQSIVKRPDNEHLFSLGSIFDDKGYVSTFVYGGYGYFDNMNYFFANNGYQIADRTDIPRENVHFGNIWGVADEDLFTLTMNEADRAYANGKPFFSHVMTTSNHPPFTFPANRIDLQSGKSGRDGAVKYTDWAIGDFIKRASTKPWFDDTVFVITADHCSASWGRTSLPLYRYHIPLLVYSPKHIEPGKIDRLMGQIDIPPTILGLLSFSYTSRFYGYDILQVEPGRERILLGNYQKVGYLRGDILTVLAPKRSAQQSIPKFDSSGDAAPLPEIDEKLIDEAVAYYQTASYRFGHGLMKEANRQ